MITTSEEVNINKIIRLGTVTTYTPDTVSLFITHDSIQKRFTATSVTNSSTTSTGVIAFTLIPLWGDGSYSFYITGEGSSDLDTNGINLSKLATGYIKKITTTNTIVA